MQTGNKVTQQVDVPVWIKENIEYSKKCVRGLIDTDGCMYIDKHIIKNKLYMNLGLNFSNHSIPILSFIKSILFILNYHPTINTHFLVFMRREVEIIRYMREIGTSNTKILRKFEEFIMKKGRVPKRS